MPRTLLLALALIGASVGAAAGQPVEPNRQGAHCPPGVTGAPVVGRESNRTLSDQLADSKGVICPPAGVDPEMQQTPAEGGTLKVIPPPGSPGGNPGAQPK